LAGMKKMYSCQECGAESLQWTGSCPRCQAWGSIQETREGSPRRTSPRPIPLSDVGGERVVRYPGWCPEWDDLLGGGLVAGSVVVLAGEPGSGKSTLALSLAASYAGSARKSLYMTTEETLGQLAERARRMGVVTGRVAALAATGVDDVLECLDQTEAPVVVIDSLQGALPGGGANTAALREFVDSIVAVAKRRNIAIVVVGQVTKEGELGGPRYFEHMVDVSLMFEVTSRSATRVISSRKNRFGPSPRTAVFKMEATGFVPVPLEAGVLGAAVAGRCHTVVRVGARSTVVEVNALVGERSGSPKWLVRGISVEKLRYLVAVIDRCLGLDLASREIMVAVPSGMRLEGAWSDLSLALALISSRIDEPCRAHLVAVGELGVLGEVRSISEAIALAKEWRGQDAVFIGPGLGHGESELRSVCAAAGISVSPLRAVS